MYMPAVIGVSVYFEKKRPLAVGIGMCGTGVGTFVFGPVSTFLLKQFGWKGAHYILGKMIIYLGPKAMTCLCYDKSMLWQSML